jgi:beta-lactam-binding protein with PASTA domain
VPAGFILSQCRAQRELEAGRSVAVVVSLGTRTRVVPDLRGMSGGRRRNHLEGEGLLVGRVGRVVHSGDARANT